MRKIHLKFARRFKKGQIVYCLSRLCSYSNMRVGDIGEVTNIDVELKGYSIKIKDKEPPNNYSFMKEYELGNRRDLIEKQKDLLSKQKGGKKGGKSRLCHILTT